MDKILSICHEDISAHLGATKTKNKLLRYYFWLNLVKDGKRYFRTCDPCQKVGKAREKGSLKICVDYQRSLFQGKKWPLPLSEKTIGIF